jgi:hypothetical protein
LDIVKASSLEKGKKKIKLIEGNRILFQGDSITDAGRNKEKMEPNNGSALGTGYAFIASSELMYEHPEAPIGWVECFCQSWQVAQRSTTEASLARKLLSEACGLWQAEHYPC